MPNKKILFVYGATASGKTELVDRLAQYLSIEVINMDSAQFYVPLTVGTAKPDWKNTFFKQHMFDCIDIPKVMTVSQYYQQVIPLVRAIQERGNLPVLVGGSGFYLKSLLFPIKNMQENIIAKESDSKNVKNLWQELYSIDVERANVIHPNDIYRITRALHIWYTTGIKPSLYKPEYEPIAPYVLLIAHRQKDDLLQRINERVHAMLQAGWVDEVRSLMGTQWDNFIRQRGFIGYSDIMEYINNEKSLDLVTASIQQKTRQYAKRQEVFGRMLIREIDKNIIKSECKFQGDVVEFDLTSAQLGLYIKQLLHKLC